MEVRFSYRHLHFRKTDFVRLSFVSVARSFSLLRLGRLVCVRLLFALANLCLCQTNVFENKFSAIICQSQQSSIATSPLRSPLGFCRRSIRWWLMGMCFFSFQFSAFSFPFDWLLPPFDSGKIYTIGARLSSLN